jgi:hypothetical protein
MWVLHNNEVWRAQRILRSVVNTRFVGCISSRYVLCTLNRRRRKRKKPNADCLFHERKEWQHCRDDSNEVQTISAWYKQLGLHSLTRPSNFPWYKRSTESMCPDRSKFRKRVWTDCCRISCAHRERHSSTGAEVQRARNPGMIHSGCCWLAHTSQFIALPVSSISHCSSHV